MLKHLSLASALLAAGLLPGAHAAKYAPEMYGNQIIVKFKQSDNGKSQAMNASKLQALSSDMKTTFHYKRRTGMGSEVFRLPEMNEPDSMDALITKLNLREDVEYAEIDYKRYPATLTNPNDTFFVDGSQWYLQDNSAAANRGAVNAVGAWEQGATGQGVVIGVIDTGFAPHIDQSSNILRGHDFISLDSGDIPATAGDGDGRDADASDPGDSVSQSEKDNLPPLRDDPNCQVQPESSWHGTLVSGLLSAAHDNAQGIAALVPDATIVLSRALGKCGGFNSDIMDAALWSAGLLDDSFGPAPARANIINLSLGGATTCSITEQSAINRLASNGVLVVVAAGNEAIASANSSPGNCSNTINVAATTRDGGETSYTNFGSDVDLSAPGGSTPPRTSCSNSESNCIITLTQDQVTGPITTPSTQYAEVFGTSFSAPVVSGIIAMMLDAARDSGVTLTTETILGTLTNTVTVFPTGVSIAQGGDAPRDCTTGNCGAGIANANAAVSAVRNGQITSMAFPSKNSLPVAADGSTTNNTTTPTTNASSGGGGALSLWLLSTLGLLLGYRRWS